MWRLSVVLLAGLLLGAAFGRASWGLAVALALALTWHYWQLHRLLGVLSSRRAVAAPEGWGVFSEVQQRLYLRQREARQRKQRLRGLLRSFREAAAALPDGVVVVARQDLRIAWFNAAAGALLGLRQPVDVGTPLNHLIRMPRVIEWLEGGAAEPLIDIAAPNRTDLRLSMRLIDYTREQRLLIVRDISKLMQLEHVRRDFVANVSHELRTPLTVIHGYLELLEPAEAPAWAEVISEMRKQSARMTSIVEDLLTLSRLESLERLQGEPVDMKALLAALKRDAEALSAGRHQIEIIADCEARIDGSPKELQSAFSNLVSNAIRYTQPGGRVVIRWTCADSEGADFIVEDNGPGIAPQHLPRITERFYRVSASRSRDSGGTGLGLAIVKHALQLHQAELQVRSEVGVGSSFRCRFPAERLLPGTTP